MPRAKATPKASALQKGPDPWDVQDPWSSKEAFDLAETFEDVSGNEVMNVSPADLKPGIAGYSVVPPHDLPAIAAIVRAARPPGFVPCEGPWAAREL